MNEISNDQSAWNGKPLDEVLAYLLRTHHPYTKRALEELMPLLDKVVRVHGEAHPELGELRALFISLRDDLQLHLMKEENILFPFIAALGSGAPVPAPPFGSVANPIRMMRGEHEADSEILHRMRAITNGFAAPDGACGSYVALYAGMRELVDDLMRHIWLENNVLFPRAIECEGDASGRA